MNKYIFKDINNKSWNKLLSETFPYDSPKSIGMRIQPPHSEFFMQPCPSLGLMALPIFDNFARALPNQDFKIWSDTPTYYIGFALEEEPSLADYHYTKFKRMDNSSPVIIGQYIQKGIKYTFKYYTNTFKKYVQDTTCVECEIENISLYNQMGCIRMKPYFITMNNFVFSHYISYIWDKSKWSFDETCDLKDNYFYLNNKLLGKIVDTNMNYNIEDKYISKDIETRHLPNTYNIYRYPTAQCDNQILDKVINTIKFEKELKPFEKAYFKINVLSNYDLDDNDINYSALNTNVSVDKSINYYKDEHKNKTKLKFSEGNIENIYYSNINQILQMTVDFEKVNNLYPTQGGIDERHLMWLWESYFMVLPLISLGYYDLFKSVVEYIFSLQDSTYTPEGRFTDLDGAIGTPGPRWVNTTGTALSYITSYFNITKDKEFIDTYLDKILKAGHWIVRQLNSTKIYENGEKVPYYGLMPYGKVSDNDFGHGICVTDSYTYNGLWKLVDLLKILDHKDKDFFEKELIEYKENIAYCVSRIRYKSGRIPILVPTDDAIIGNDFDNVDGALNLIYAGAVDVNSKDIKDFIKDFEENSCTDYLTGTITEDTIYTGFTDLYLQKYYISTKEYKKAWECWNMVSKFGMTQDTYLVQERYSLTDPFWCPWQPNGSGSGRILLMIINGIYLETDEEIILFGGFPFEWLADNKETYLEELNTPLGKVTVKANYENNKIKVSLTGNYDKNKKIVLQDERFELV